MAIKLSWIRSVVFLAMFFSSQIFAQDVLTKPYLLKLQNGAEVEFPVGTRLQIVEAKTETFVARRGSNTFELSCDYFSDNLTVDVILKQKFKFLFANGSAIEIPGGAALKAVGKSGDSLLAYYRKFKIIIPLKNTDYDRSKMKLPELTDVALREIIEERQRVVVRPVVVNVAEEYMNTSYEYGFYVKLIIRGKISESVYDAAFIGAYEYQYSKNVPSYRGAYFFNPGKGFFGLGLGEGDSVLLKTSHTRFNSQGKAIILVKVDSELVEVEMKDGFTRKVPVFFEQIKDQGVEDRLVDLYMRRGFRDMYYKYMGIFNPK